MWRSFAACAISMSDGIVICSDMWLEGYTAPPLTTRRSDRKLMLQVETCPSCGAGIGDAFCAACGERRPSARIYTIGEFASEAFEAFTNVERSFLRTFWTLIRKP